MRVMEAGSWWPRAALICGMFAIKSIFDHSILLLPLFKALAHSGTQQDPSIVKRRSIAHGLLLASLAQALLSAVVCPLVLWGISHFDDEYLKRATGEEMPHDLMTALDVLAELPRGAREALLFFSFGGRRRFLDQILQQRLAALRRARRADYASTEAPSSEPEASEGEQGQREGEDQEWDEDIESLDMQEQGDVRSRHTHTHSRHQRSPLRSPAAPPSSTPQHVPVRSLLAAPPLPPPVHANIPSASGSASAHANANTAAAAGPNSAASPPLNPVPAEGFPVPQE
uniref:Uncharacterized protein n=1 Tax=Chromera velia CCMP2878 TaxID=1169474 RepID=A0A0G4IAU2_9ALVE|eukprot:Cvel_12668.t1-p1 / transcript=Cvel_12668.t1 / gene=Cvel_12668 / organism=Chromera_velia_CCMP2878 / gene_product=hypothetical protein / transcript_product=hypothetical protein / location=Cvel_scaffold837:48742-49593(-) / protein_length=284 / sequence_SO=supercontig / SO=protein_coding / is_pseudo=false